MRTNDPSPSGAKAAAKRVRLIAHHALSDALHQRLPFILVLIGAAMVLGSRWLRNFNFGATELKFIADFGLGAIGLFGTLFAALATAQLFFSEVESRAIYCVFARPVRRWEFVVGKFSAVAALLALFVAALGALLGSVLLWRQAQLGAGAESVSISAFFCACALSWLKATLVASMTIFICSYANSALFASCAGLLMAVIGQLRGINPAAFWGQLWPNLSLYDAEGLLAVGSLPGAAWLTAIAVHWVAYVAVFVGLASYAFSRREL